MIRAGNKLTLDDYRGALSLTILVIWPLIPFIDFFLTTSLLTKRFSTGNWKRPTHIDFDQQSTVAAHPHMHMHTHSYSITRAMWTLFQLCRDHCAWHVLTQSLYARPIGLVCVFVSFRLPTAHFVGAVCVCVCAFVPNQVCLTRTHY